MNKLAKVIIGAIIIVLLVVVIGSLNSREVNNGDSVVYADFGDGIESDGHELVGNFPIEAAVAANHEQAAERVAEEFIEALNMYQNGEQDLEKLGTYKQPDEEGNGYMATFEFTGDEGRMEALVYVSGSEARLKNLSQI